MTPSVRLKIADWVDLPGFVTLLRDTDYTCAGICLLKLHGANFRELADKIKMRKAGEPIDQSFLTRPVGGNGKNLRPIGELAYDDKNGQYSYRVKFFFHQNRHDEDFVCLKIQSSFHTEECSWLDIYWLDIDEVLRVLDQLAEREKSEAHETG
jgi:hypothetical protein